MLLGILKMDNGVGFAFEILDFFGVLDFQILGDMALPNIKKQKT